MPDPQYLSTDPNAGEYLSTDPNAGTPVEAKAEAPAQDNSALGAIGRGLSSFWEQINPVAAVQGAGQALMHPIDTAKGLGQSQGEQYTKAAKSFQEGDYITGARHAINYLLPIIGPAMDVQSEKGAKGDIAGMIGGSLGLGAAIAAPELAKRVGVPTLPNAANRIEQSAESKFVGAISPKVGPQKLRFNAMAAKVAPEALRDPELGAFSRQALQQKVLGKLEQSEQGLDAANAARNVNARYGRDPVRADLQKKLDALATEGGVIPAPDQPRANVIKQAIAELDKEQPTLNYDTMKRNRQSYDQVARAKYAPVAADYLTKQNEASGAADVANVYRSHMAKFDPQTAAANAPYHLYRTLNDVLQATEEAERARPTKGRAIAARIAGSVAGEGAGGMEGAILGWLAGPMIDEAMNAGVTTKIATARAMTELADALRAGNVTKAKTALYRIASMTRTTAGLRTALAGGTALPAAAETEPAATQ